MTEREEYLLKEANIARHVGVFLAEAIYKYLGEDISRDQLKESVDLVINKDMATKLYHQHILKDTYTNALSNMFTEDLNTSFEDADIEDLKIIE